MHLNLQEVLAATTSQEREMWATFAALGMVALAVLVAAILVWLVNRVAGVRAARRARREVDEPVVSSFGFPVVTEAGVATGAAQVGQPVPVQEVARGPGRYRIVGVVAATGTDIQMYVNAETPANAKVKAELKGVVVTEVEKQ